jgi:hypothetical protein
VEPSISPARVRHVRFESGGVLEVLVTVLGGALTVAAAAASQPWLDRHFLPSFFLPRPWYVLIETAVRVGIATAGVWLVLARARIARALTREAGMAVGVLAAAVLAVLAGEAALRWISWRPTEWLAAEEEPRRREDARLGWVLVPARSGDRVVSDRTLEYAIDAAGYRVRHVSEPVDPQRPTLVFAGESVMFGEGLTWEESIPAQVGVMLGIQSANLAVHGYSTDQICMRVAAELPHFRQPVSVVVIFMTELFGRNLDDDRPHLGPGLVWQPAVHKSRLMSLVGMLVPYRRTRTVERGIQTSRESLVAIVELARHRGATPLVIVPQFGIEDDEQRMIRQGVLGDDVPAVMVELDPEWRLAWDRHPNASAAHAIAAAVAARLHGR